MKTCDRNSIKSVLEISGELLPSEHRKRVGWDGARKCRSQNVLLGPHGTGIAVNKNVPADRSRVGSTPLAGCLTEVLFLGYQMQTFNFWLVYTSRLFYFYRVFSALEAPAGTCCCSLARRALAAPLHPAADGHCCEGRAPSHRFLIPSRTTGLIPSPAWDPTASRSQVSS